MFSFLQLVSDYLWTYVVITALVFCALYFTILIRGLQFTHVKDMLKGPSAFAFGYDDPVAPAKIIKEFIKKTKKCAIKGGIVDGRITDAAGIEALAELPSREVLIARMLGSMMSPITGLAIALDQVAKKLGGGAEAPAAETAAE